MATSYPVGGNVRWEGHEYVESVGTFSRRKRWTHWSSVDRVLRGCFRGVLDCHARGWELVLFWMASVNRWFICVWNWDTGKWLRRWRGENLKTWLSFAGGWERERGSWGRTEARVLLFLRGL